MDQILKMLANQKNPEEFIKLIEQLQNASGKPFVDLADYQDAKFNLRPDEKVTPGKFKADPLLPGGYKAHPRTIEAMKKNILMAGEDVTELSIPYDCVQCNAHLDIQFWKFCPHCGSQFKDVGDKF